MWHVDEGALHAYLDGALDALPASEAARIREHIASCPSCGARLEEERALRAEAEAILSGSAPAVGPLPPFEELRATARARRRAGSGSRLQRLSWAATIVLAVGAGWLLRGSQGGRFAGDPASGPPPQAPSADVASAGDAPGLEVASRTEMDPAVTEAAGAPADADPRRGAPVAGGGATEPARLAQADAAPPAARAPAPTAPAADVEEPARSLAATRERVAAMAAERPRPVEELRARGELVGVPTAGGNRGSVGAPPPSVMVPGLEVLEVGRAGALFPEGTMRVLQRLDRDTLELIHLPEGSGEPDAATELPDGRAQAVVPLGGGWLVGRARVGPERLRALLALVRGSDGEP